MSFEFKNWKKFREYINIEALSVVKFDLKYHTCDFSIVYGLEQNVFFVGKKGTQVAFPVYLDWYKASVILDKEHYRELVQCKDEPYDSNKPYSPIDFLISLDNTIGSNPTLTKATPVDIHTITKNSIPDEEKIFFQRFMPHTTGKRHVTGANIAKVRKILGQKIAEFCKKNNVSVAFTNQPTESSFNMIENPKKALEEQNDI